MSCKMIRDQLVGPHIISSKQQLILTLYTCRFFINTISVQQGLWKFGVCWSILFCFELLYYSNKDFLIFLEVGSSVKFLKSLVFVNDIVYRRSKNLLHITIVGKDQKTWTCPKQFTRLRKRILVQRLLLKLLQHWLLHPLCLEHQTSSISSGFAKLQGKRVFIF